MFSSSSCIHFKLSVISLFPCRSAFFSHFQIHIADLLLACIAANVSFVNFFLLHLKSEFSWFPRATWRVKVSCESVFGYEYFKTSEIPTLETRARFEMVYLATELTTLPRKCIPYIWYFNILVPNPVKELSRARNHLDSPCKNPTCFSSLSEDQNWMSAWRRNEKHINMNNV